MKHSKIKTFLTLIFLPALWLGAQDCTDYHQYHCEYADYTFFYSRQSKSALFQHGQTSELNIVAYGGEDYYVSVCGHKKFESIRFRILEDNESRSLIYDNASDNYANSIVFSNELSRNLILEVSTPEFEKNNGKTMHCVGVVIQFRKSK